MREAFIEKAFNRQSLDRIEKANSIIRAYAAQGYRLSLRQLYYQFVSRDYLANTVRNYSNLGGLISDARLAGLIDWNAIEDRGRVARSNNHWDSPASILRASAAQFMYDRWTEQPCHVEVMVEKDALSGVLEPVCNELDINFTANKGYSSSSYMYEFAKRLMRMERKGKEVHVIYLGDHDPSGMDMTRDIGERLELFMRGQSVSVNRVALNMDQVETYEPPENPAKTTDSRYAAYVTEFGESSWELDALEPTVLASLVRNTVENLIDQEAWQDALDREEEARARLRTYADDWETEQGED